MSTSARRGSHSPSCTPTCPCSEGWVRNGCRAGSSNRWARLGFSRAETTLDEVYERMAEALGPEIVAAGPEALFDEPSRLQLMERWPGFLPVTV